MPPPLLLAIMGPTASGKSALAERLADDLDAQLINADAFQIYRGMDIGTAKPTDPSRYRLLDLKAPNESFGVGEFIGTALPELQQLFSNGRHTIVVGGTGLYVRALMEEYTDMGEAPDPALRAALDQRPHDEKREELERIFPDIAARVDLNNPVRVQRALERALDPRPSVEWHLPPFRKIKLALVPETATTNDRITLRIQSMVQNGWVEEVSDLLNQGFTAADPGFRAIGYRTLTDHLESKVDLQMAIDAIAAETRAYAKRQRTWLRSEPNLQRLPDENPLDEARKKLALLLREE